MHGEREAAGEKSRYRSIGEFDFDSRERVGAGNANADTDVCCGSAESYVRNSLALGFFNS